ncbi:MAG: FixH family protein [Aequorivita sp.]
MKINWGTGLVIGMVLFVSFILYFVIRISTEKKFDYDLVTEEYYKQEMFLQGEIDAQENSIALKGEIHGKKTAEGWLLTFPDDLDYSAITGIVSMYRPSDKRLDFDLPLKLSNGQVLIPEERLVNGRWNTIINWQYEGKNYLYREKITY